MLFYYLATSLSECGERAKKSLLLERAAVIAAPSGVGRGELPPGPNPKPDVQVSKHPAFQMILVSPESSLDFFDIHLEASRFSEHLRRPERIILRPFAM